ncbi:MAG: glutathione-disulfide reductase [Magnetospirillum sp. WYHS-4]
MSRFDYDLLTVGAGSGGVRASRFAARTGARVAICEESRVGGTCVIRGCVPKKLLVMGAQFGDAFADAAGFGWTVDEPVFDWPTLIARKNAEIDRLNGVYKRILRESDVDLIEDRAVVVDPHTVEVAGRRVTAANILIAVGGWPSTPAIPGIEHVISSNEALDLPDLPRRVAIVGGGYIAVEFAGIFAGFGVQVTQVLRGDTVLRGFDEDLRVALAEEMGKRGIRLRTDTVVRSVEKLPAGGFSLHLGHEEMLETDLVMYATGRVPKTALLGLEETGVRLDDKGAVAVDDFSRSSVPSIWAIGDATDRMNLTPVALAEGMALARTLFEGTPTRVDYDNVPTAVFSQPPLATVGLTEAQARDRFGKVDIYVTRFRPMKHSLSGRDERSLMKLVVDAATDRVVGCHMVGQDAPEIVQGFAVALKCGARKRDFDATIGIHPTAAEEFVTLRDKLPDHPKR